MISVDLKFYILIFFSNIKVYFSMIQMLRNFLLFRNCSRVAVPAFIAAAEVFSSATCKRRPNLKINSSLFRHLTLVTT